MIHRRLSRLLLPIWLTVAALGLVDAADSAELARPLEPIAAKLEPTRTIVYKTVNGRSLHLHVFGPMGHQATDRRPAFLLIHGGGWTGGNARKFYPFADHFARLGMVGVSLEYRLINARQGTTVFDCVKDGRSAVRYLRAHAPELGIDAQKIVVGGGSAGGHVAAGTALFDGIDEEGEDTSVSCTPNALVLYYPVIDTSPDGYGQKKIGERWRELSPVDNVKANLPPTILFHGTGDTVTPYEGAKRFSEQMQKVGNACEVVSHDGGRHGYFIFDLELCAQVMKHTEKFLKANGFLAETSGSTELVPQYTIADLEVKVLAAKPDRYFGRCAVQKLKDGTWFLVYHESGHHWKYEPQKPQPVLSGVLHARFSADHGTTWSDEDRYLDGSPINGFPAFPPGAEPDNADYEPGEPWAYLAPNGDLVVHSLKDNFNTRKWDGTWQMRSSDGGRTWTNFTKIDFVGLERDECIWAIDDHVIVDGVIYMGAREIPMPEFWKGMRNLLVKSTDNGLTWQLVSYVTEKKGIATEQGIEYLGNNTILCVLNSVDRRHTWLTRSHDMGQTWEPLRDIASQVRIWDRPRIFTAAHLRNEPNWWQDQLILGTGDERTRPGSSFPRRNCLWLSPDRGSHWQVFDLDDETEDAGYGGMVYDDENQKYVAILYHGNHTEAVLKQYKFRIAEATDVKVD